MLLPFLFSFNKKFLLQTALRHIKLIKTTNNLIQYFLYVRNNKNIITQKQNLFFNNKTLNNLLTALNNLLTALNNSKPYYFFHVFSRKHAKKQNLKTSLELFLL